ncbi:hypothetical protein HPS54_05240 [Prevotella sp. PCHR]|uniref:Uncharacterized protein n=1 Tax=Xylanibacter caecicola TaxID=2736294 RepID=A0ABX2B0I5_9BACT|nr:hypothetical protein [Xylanibacter caecicola]NPE24926.1 hypothetical protein [Xylanibacter caecicola]
MKKYHWNLLLEPDMTAPKSGIYLLAIRNDNHISYQCHKMNEGDSFYRAVGRSTTDPTDWFVPIAYHFCNKYVCCNNLTMSSFVTEDSWYPCNSDIETEGLRVLPFTVNGVLKYDLTNVCCTYLPPLNLGYSEGDLHYVYESKYKLDIKRLAYHYVEYFGEEGHSYWWDEYKKIHPNIK